MIAPQLNFKKLFLFLGVISVTFCAFAQNAPYVPNRVIPPPPEATAMAKYGDIPVGYFTGVPQISIPIYTLSAGDFRLPISLNYHASGVKVNEIASNVGLGWTLSAGGMISCTVNDIWDFDVNGFQEGQFANQVHTSYANGDFAQYEESTGSQVFGPTYELLNHIAAGAYDGQPDLFNFNFADKAGTFAFDETGTIRTIPFVPYKITRDATVNSFTIIEEKGVKFQFSELELSTVTPNGTSDCGDMVNWFYSNGNYAPVWHLKKITTPSGQEISFVYENYTYSYTMQGSQTNFLPGNPSGAPGGIPNCPTEPMRTCNYVNEVAAKRLIAIQSNQGHEILFRYKGTNRIDLTGSKALDSILVKRNGSLINSFALTQDYFGSTQTGLAPEFYRLRLLGVKEQNKPPYLFEYNAVPVPSRNSLSQDFWGFYNGKGNPTLIPKTWIDFRLYGDADRNVDPQLMQMGVLRKMVYPTGGHTDFLYEPHDFKYIGKQRTHVNRYESLQLSEIEDKSLTFTTGAFTGGSGPIIDAQIVFQTNVSSPLPPGEYIVGELIGQTLPATIYFETLSSILSIRLAPNSTYTLKLRSNTDVFSTGGGWQQINANISVNWTDANDRDTVRNVQAGGLRIVKIVNHDLFGKDTSVRRYVYRHPSDTAFSSGNRVSDPVNTYFQRHVYYETTSNGNIRRFCDKYVQSSNSFNSVMGIKGSLVGYEYVTELYGASGENGKRVNRYKMYPDNPDFIVNLISDHQTVFKFWPDVFHKATSYDWIRGLLLEEKLYKYSNNNYTAVQESIYDYKFADNIGCFLPCVNSSPNQKSILGIKPVIVDPEHQTSPDLPVSILAKFKVLPQYIISDWYTLSKKTTTLYSQQAGQPNVVTLETFKYDYPLHGLPTLLSSVSSKGDTVRTKIIHSLDYNTGTSSNASSQGIKLLVEKHLIRPIEEIYIRSVSGIEYVYGGRVTTYQSDKPVVAKVYTLPLGSQVPLSSFTVSHINSAGNFVKDSRYVEEFAFNKYDVFGNILEMNKVNDHVTSYIWDYNSSFPVAEAKNALESEIAYTSFESTGSGNWSIPSAARVTNASVTGSKSYSLTSGAIGRNGLTSNSEYVVAYWINSSTPATVSGTQGTPVKLSTYGNWSFFEHTIAGVTSLSVSGSSNIDELRLYPGSSLMTTFTYSPTGGMTSQADPDGGVLFFQYDTSGQLKTVRNQNGQVLKQLDYQYQKPVTQ